MPRRRIAFTADQLQQVELLAGYGLTDAEIARALGVSPHTLSTRKRDTRELAETIARGKARAAETVGKALFGRAKRGNVPAIKWWEQTRRGLAEKLEHTGADGGPLEVIVTRRIVHAKSPADGND